MPPNTLCISSTMFYFIHVLFVVFVEAFFYMDYVDDDLLGIVLDDDLLGLGSKVWCFL